MAKQGAQGAQARGGRLPRPSLTDWYQSGDAGSVEQSRLARGLGGEQGRVAPDSATSPFARQARFGGASGKDEVRFSAATSPSMAARLEPDLQQQLDANGFFIWDDTKSRDLSSQETLVRGLCAGYMETQMSPLLRYLRHMKEAQDTLMAQLAEVREDLDIAERRAMASEVVTRKTVEDIVAAEFARRAETGTAGDFATLRRLEELAAAVERKVDAHSVPSLAQMRLVMEKADRKAEAQDVARLREDIDALRAQLSASATSEAAAAATPSAFFLQATRSSNDNAAIQKVQVLEKQLKELWQHVHEMRREGKESPSIVATPFSADSKRQPEKVIVRDSASDASSETASLAGSSTGSLAGSALGMGSKGASLQSFGNSKAW